MILLNVVVPVTTYKIFQEVIFNKKSSQTGKCAGRNGGSTYDSYKVAKTLVI